MADTLVNSDNITLNIFNSSSSGRTFHIYAGVKRSHNGEMKDEQDDTVGGRMTEFLWWSGGVFPLGGVKYTLPLVIHHQYNNSQASLAK